MDKHYCNEIVTASASSWRIFSIANQFSNVFGLLFFRCQICILIVKISCCNVVSFVFSKSQNNESWFTVFIQLLLGFLIKPDKCFTCISWGWGRCSWNTRGERSFTCSILDCCSFNINSEALWTPWKNEQTKKNASQCSFYLHVYTRYTRTWKTWESINMQFQVKISSNQDVTSLAKLYGT